MSKKQRRCLMTMQEGVGNEPSEDELQDDYNDWLSRYVVGGWEREEQ